MSQSPSDSADEHSGGDEPGPARPPWYVRWGPVGWSVAFASVSAVVMLAVLVLVAIPRGRLGCGGRAAQDPGASPSPSPSLSPSPSPSDAGPSSTPVADSTQCGGCDDACSAACNDLVDDTCDSLLSGCGDSSGCGGSGGCDVGGGDCSGYVVPPGDQAYTELLAALPALVSYRAAPTVPARLGMAAIRAYRRWLSPRLAVRCRYTPTCSQYGMEAIRRYGLAAGARLAYARVRRCTHRVPYGTADPVPVPG